MCPFPCQASNGDEATTLRLARRDDERVSCAGFGVQVALTRHLAGRASIDGVGGDFGLARGT
jgi:hypothetical protein